MREGVTHTTHRNPIMTITIDTAIPSDIRRDIAARLKAIEAEQDVRLLMAVESGSRAWGFPSPDSDYDVRFVYVRPRDWYLSLTPGRDVIETPIEDEIDLNGWDVRKMLGLLLRSNAIAGEWLGSPIRYCPDDPFVARLRAFVDSLFDPRALAHHYASLGRGAADRWLGRDGEVPVKKYFYALRPALAVRALRMAPAMRPPMNLQALVQVADLPVSLTARIDDLVAMKARTNEWSNGIRLPELEALIADELARASDVAGAPIPPEARARADDLFLQLVNA